MLLKSRQDVEEFVFWCVTLQCEVLPRGQGCLQAGDGFCCLGVGVVCSIPESRLLLRVDGSLQGFTPEAQIYSPGWLRDVNMEVQHKTMQALSYRNDTLKHSHKEIGTLLLKLYEDELNYWFSVVPGK